MTILPSPLRTATPPLLDVATPSTSQPRAYAGKSMPMLSRGAAIPPRKRTTCPRGRRRPMKITIYGWSIRAAFGSCTATTSAAAIPTSGNDPRCLSGQPEPDIDYTSSSRVTPCPTFRRSGPATQQPVCPAVITMCTGSVTTAGAGYRCGRDRSARLDRREHCRSRGSFPRLVTTSLLKALITVMDHATARTGLR
jgi:hypothetical protein